MDVGAASVDAPANSTGNAHIVEGSMFIRLSNGFVVNTDLIAVMTPGRLVMSAGGEVALASTDVDMLNEILIPKTKVSLEALRPEPVPAPPEATVPQGSYQRNRSKPQSKPASLSASNPETVPSVKGE